MKTQRVFLYSLFCAVSLFLSGQQRYKGYPSASGEIDIRSNFAHPPKGYGNVPFYWWNGDSLKRDRLEAQLAILKEASTDGFAVSYIHSHPQADVELNAKGYGGFGRTVAGAPHVFSEKWWETWNWFSAKCAQEGIGLGLDDYTVGWQHNGYYIDELLQDSSIANYQGRLQIETHLVEAGKQINLHLSAKPLQIVAFPGAKELTKQLKGDQFTWQAPADKAYKVYVIYTQPSPELHPQYGKRVVEVYFERFKQRMDNKGVQGMNYFFQDELHYPLKMNSFAEDLPAEFLKRKGYNILPYLPALVDTIGDITPKIRLDYAEVLTQLSEERYFKPIFDWHASKGLIYGCDNNGRGLEPTEYVDYFRLMSWFTAPGNDAPARGSSFRQTKVSSSISHLYQRPRTWLEAFHSMGWSSNGEWLTKQLDHHIVAGGNLLCLHGLYYSTHGGWWEWAPPCFHFRMPYWPHMKRWLQYAERLSFVLSQGTHVCDIAVLYPTESMHAYPKENGGLMWSVTDSLSIHGLDYDFIDYQSLQKAEISKGQLSVAGEQYKVLILADMKALHHETLLKIRNFHRQGGIVIATGSLPVATSKTGANNREVKDIIEEIFHSQAPTSKGIIEEDYTQIVPRIHALITPDFTNDGKHGRVLHRKIGEQNVYMVTDVAKGATMFFRATGKVECWQAKDGQIIAQPVLEQTQAGTWIKFDAETGTSLLLVFSPGTPTYVAATSNQWQVSNTLPITGEWNVEIVPTMHNKWGDFRLPATDEYIGAEAREFSYAPLSLLQGHKIKQVPQLPIDTPTGLYGYAPYMETVTLPASVNLKEYLQAMPSDANWQPYCFSWQYGVRDNPGSQGYHGLKGKVENHFLILDQGGHQLFRTFVHAPTDGWYDVIQEGVVPDFLCVDGVQISSHRISLAKGWHPFLLGYANTSKGSYVLAQKQSYSIDNRKRSSVVLYPDKHAPLQEVSPYDTIVAMKWYHSEHLAFNPTQEQDCIWKYSFYTAPGTKEMKLNLNGELIQLWIDGKEVKKKQWKQTSPSGVYTILIPQVNPFVSNVTLTAKPHIGFHGAALFASPVKLTCAKGRMPVGDWSQFGALKYYSGGVKYQKQIQIAPSLKERKVTLDLGVVDATCEVWVNGQQVDVLMSPPFRIDITKWIKEGDNNLEVLVYSTLSNHYQEVPSAYRGIPHAGLVGPVQLIEEIR